MFCKLKKKKKRLVYDLQGNKLFYRSACTKDLLDYVVTHIGRGQNFLELSDNIGPVRDFSHVSLGHGTPCREREREREKTCLWRFAKFSLSFSVVVFKNCTLFLHKALSL